MPDLNETDRAKLDGIVKQMVANGESDQYIQGVVNDFKQKYGSTRADWTLTPRLNPHGPQPAPYAEGTDPGDTAVGRLVTALNPFAHPAIIDPNSHPGLDIVSMLMPSAIGTSVSGALHQPLPLLEKSLADYAGGVSKVAGGLGDMARGLLPPTVRRGFDVVREAAPWNWNSPLTVAGREAREAAQLKAFNELPLAAQMKDLPTTGPNPVTTRAPGPPSQLLDQPRFTDRPLYQQMEHLPETPAPTLGRGPEPPYRPTPPTSVPANLQEAYDAIKQSVGADKADRWLETQLKPPPPPKEVDLRPIKKSAPGPTAEETADAWKEPLARDWLQRFANGALTDKEVEAGVTLMKQGKTVGEAVDTVTKGRVPAAPTATGTGTPTDIPPPPHVGWRQARQGPPAAPPASATPVETRPPVSPPAAPPVVDVPALRNAPDQPPLWGASPEPPPYATKRLDVKPWVREMTADQFSTVAKLPAHDQEYYVTLRGLGDSHEEAIKSLDKLKQTETAKLRRGAVGKKDTAEEMFSSDTGAAFNKVNELAPSTPGVTRLPVRSFADFLDLAYRRLVNDPTKAWLLPALGGGTLAGLASRQDAHTQ